MKPVPRCQWRGHSARRIPARSSRSRRRRRRCSPRWPPVPAIVFPSRAGLWWPRCRWRGRTLRRCGGRASRRRRRSSPPFHHPPSGGERGGGGLWPPRKLEARRAGEPFASRCQQRDRIRRWCPYSPSRWRRRRRRACPPQPPPPPLPGPRVKALSSPNYPWRGHRPLPSR